MIVFILAIAAMVGYIIWSLYRFVGDDWATYSYTSESDS